MVGYNQKGYVGQSMSVRARKAYESGEMPLSKWTKQAIIDEMEWQGYSNDVIDNARTYPLSELREVALERSSYHHTSKYANRTDFYSLKEDLSGLKPYGEEESYDIEANIRNEKESMINEISNYLAKHKGEKATIDYRRGNAYVVTDKDKVGTYVDYSLNEDDVNKLVDLHNMRTNDGKSNTYIVKVSL